MAVCCPVIRVKCSRRKVKGKLKCTIRMAGKKWRTSPEKARAKVLQLKERMMKKGCRGEVDGAIPAEGWVAESKRKGKGRTARVAVVNFPKRMAPSTESWPPARIVRSSWAAEEAPYPGYPGTEE